jgi:hypothetical protein
MGNKSAYLENAQLNWLKGTTYPAAPATVYVALFTVTPTDAGAGTEVTGGSYARAAITTSTGWSSISGTPEQISNGGIVTFATPTASWGTVVAIAVFDALTAGNLLYWNAITSQAIASGVVASFAVGTLILTDD